MTALHAPFAGWLSTLDEVADPVFAERMMGDGFAIDPTEGVLRAPADGVVATIAASAHAVTLRLAEGAEVLLHVGLDTVALGGTGFAVQVTEGQAVRRGDPLIAFDLDAVARAARDLVTPVVLPGEGVRVAVDRPGRLVAAGDVVARIETGAVSHSEAATGETLHRRITITAPHGLHARPAARIGALLKPFAAEVAFARAGRYAAATSPTALLALGAKAGDVLDLTARGPDAAAALDALERFAGERFGDAEGESDTVAVPKSSGAVCASPGLAIGTIVHLRPAEVRVVEEARGVAHERAALTEALAAVDAALSAQRGGIAEAHRALLADPALLGTADGQIAEGRSAGIAWRTAIDEAATALDALDDPRLRERVADLRDLERQVLLALSGETAALPALPPDAILVAEDLLPSHFLALDRTRLAGIATAAGGPTAHVAILAAAAGVPMIVAAGPAVVAADEGATAILDADAAQLTVAPDPEALAAASQRIAAARAARADSLRAAQAPAATADGHRVEVFANLGSVEDTAAAVAAGAEGCGLLRTEFLFLDRDMAPSEEEQRALYARIAATLGDRPLIVRTLDIGGDKPVAYLPFAPEENPALGRRGVRLSLARPDLFATQLRAILAAVPGAQCRVMLPMVVDAGELAAARALLDEAAAAVGRADRVELGVMIETPAAALLADQLAEHADFLSVGTNDLTQYALAADRGNAAVSAMVDALHPAVLRLIHAAGQGAAKHDRWLGVCGGLASDPRAAPLLIGLGVGELSAVPAQVPAIKAAVRATTFAEAKALAGRALACRSAAEVRALLDDHA